MDYTEWEKAIPDAIRSDSLWKMKAYRIALFLGDVGWHDVTRLVRDRRTVELSDKLYRSLGSISANLAEGYSRGTGRDRARFYEYALGSARESRDWYFKSRHILGEVVAEHRSRLITEVIRLLLTIVPQQRNRVLREDGIEYETRSSGKQIDENVNEREIHELLHNIPLTDS